MLPPSVKDYLDSHRPRHLERYMELLRFASVANVQAADDPCQQAAHWLADYVRGLGFSARIVPTANKPNVLAEARVSDTAPTLLIYGHYDVQPPDPLELWLSDPFQPTVRDGAVYARGANDDKGQLMTHLMALEAWIKAGGGLPLNVRLFIEGEEEIGSPQMERFVTDHRRELAADAIAVSDSEFFAEGVPTITYGLRGACYFEVTLRALKQDVHSGLHGGAIANPINKLAAIIAAMHDADGRVTLPGFYDDVLPLSPDERRAWAALRVDEKAYAEELGIGALAGGEKGLGLLERRWGRPTLDCNGIVGGYIGKGSKTIIPACAHAKITTRLVPNQSPAKIEDGFKRFVAEHTPPGMTAEVSISPGARPVLFRTDSPAMNAAKAAYREGFGKDVTLIRCGASVPVTEQFQRLLGVDPVMMDFGLPTDNLHGPNEHFKLSQLYGGAVTAAAFYANLRQQLGK